MSLIVETAALGDFCARQARAEFIAIDTEFMRDRTYWPELCLVQIAGPEEAAAIDPLSPKLELSPLFRLLADPAVLKVFHAARQDIEIFYQLTGAIPAPLFDTQVAAMVCGFGDAVSYETLAGKLAGAHIDKSARFTDWSHRPLTDRQIKYALSDVVPLRTAYEKLRLKLDHNGRRAWLAEEMAVLTDPNTYALDPREAWRRFKLRSANRRTLGVLRELAAWRELAAQQRNLPRNRILRDEQLMEIASHPPASLADLARTRGLGKGFVEGRFGVEVLEAVQTGLALPAGEQPELPSRQEIPPGIGPLVDLLRVLLKLRSEEHGVASRLVASGDDLERMAASDSAEVPALVGWRREVFGEDALRLKHGKLALTAAGKQIHVMRVGPS